MNNMLEGKTILITGASSGIGRETAIFCSQQGARVILNGRDKLRLTETLQQLQGSGHIIIAGDISNTEMVNYVMDETFKSVGVLDALIHSAGIQITVPIRALKEEHYTDTFDNNVKSALLLAKAFRRKGRYNSEGSSLLFLSSVAATNGNSSNAVYSASKAAVEGLSKSLAIELARQKIRVNCIAPALIKTNMTKDLTVLLTEEQILALQQKHPLGFGKPENVAHAAAFLSSDYAQWITGTSLLVDGGYNAQ